MIVNKFISLGSYKNRKISLHFRNTIFKSKSKICRNSDKKFIYISKNILWVIWTYVEYYNVPDLVQLNEHMRSPKTICPLGGLNSEWGMDMKKIFKKLTRG